MTGAVIVETGFRIDLTTFFKSTVLHDSLRGHIALTKGVIGIARSDGTGSLIRDSNDRSLAVRVQSKDIARARICIRTIAFKRDRFVDVLAMQSAFGQRATLKVQQTVVACDVIKIADVIDIGLHHARRFVCARTSPRLPERASSSDRHLVFSETIGSECHFRHCRSDKGNTHDNSGA